MPKDRATSTPATAAASLALHVGLAESPEQLGAANRLVRRRYAWRGYRFDTRGRRQGSIDAGGGFNELTFIAFDRGTLLGTITLRFDGPEGLRAEESNREAVDRARSEGRHVAELTRLALAEDADSRRVLAALFGVVYAVGRAHYGITDVFIEVNPRHAAFYCRALGFIVAGDPALCERVHAPSLLLKLDVEMLESRLGLAA